MIDMLSYKKRRELAENFFNNELVKEFWGGDLLSEFGMSSIKADIKDREEEYFIEADLPGVDKEQLIVEYKEEILTISAQTQKQKTEEKESYVRRERKYGKISRSFFMPKVDSGKITANYMDGVLKIKLPKLKEAINNIYRVPID